MATTGPKICQRILRLIKTKFNERKKKKKNNHQQSSSPKINSDHGLWKTQNKMYIVCAEERCRCFVWLVGMQASF